MMKQLLYFTLFLLISFPILAQSNLRMMGGGIGLSSSPYAFINGDIYYYYQSFHPIKNSRSYFTTGTKIDYNIRHGIILAGQRFGIGIKNEQTNTYNHFGMEINHMGYGLYLNKNIVFQRKNQYFVITPEIHYLYISKHKFMGNYPEMPLLLVGCGFATGWDKKEFVPKKERKHIICNHFDVGVGINYKNNRQENNGILALKSIYIDINANYRLFSKQIISPEGGIGLIQKYGFSNASVVHQSNNTYLKHYTNYADIFPYLKVGLGMQTRGKWAFIAGIALLKEINFKATGLTAKAGIKYALTDKAAISLCYEVLNYEGEVWGGTKRYERNPVTGNFELTKKTRGLHRISGFEELSSVKLGVHF